MELISKSPVVWWCEVLDSTSYLSKEIRGSGLGSFGKRCELFGNFVKEIIVSIRNMLAYLFFQD